MRSKFAQAFDRDVLGHPRLTLFLIALIASISAWFAQGFELDASSDSLLLENDQDLRYYRGIRARYGDESYLIMTYTARGELFDPETLADILVLRDELDSIERVEQVYTMLDVPLIDSPRTSLAKLQKHVPTLLSPETDMDLAKIELRESPLYSEFFMSRDGKTTGLFVRFSADDLYDGLHRERDRLREKGLSDDLSAEESRSLAILTSRIKELRVSRMDEQAADIAEVRAIMDRHREFGILHLGGLPMIVTDMISFIRHDVIVFGAGIIIFLIILLILIFRRPRWVVVSLLCATVSIVVMLGYLGMMEWRVTVVSANFVALLLIFSLSLTVHLIVRYQELHAQHPKSGQGYLISSTIRDKYRPCLFTVLTTMVAFASLLFSGIRPVIDFGWMMVTGMLVVFCFSFVIFPGFLMLFTPGVPQRRRDYTSRITGVLASWVERAPVSIVLAFVALAAISGTGIMRLEVENRFIDYFKRSTEIYQGMEVIDRELGGTTPLDVILDADPAFFAAQGEDLLAVEDVDDEFSDIDDEFMDEFDTDAEVGDDLGATSYWYNTFQLDTTVRRVHEYLEDLPETGKVLSMATTIDTLQILNHDETPGTFFLSLLYKRLPADVKATLFEPYMSDDGNQIRFSVRVYETDPNLRRDALLNKIKQELVETQGIQAERVHLTGMLVLYNNVLQSLFRSQIVTIGVVFLGILLMFLILFRSLKTAFVTVIPIMIAAASVPGVMGWFGIPLDIMTITIAAISIGIGVDDAIHYVHRFREELARDGDYIGAIRRSHRSIGRAIFFTSVIIVAGFSILSLSNFIPTIFFGLLTGFSMLIALVANLTLLPVLLRLTRAS
jgi:hypothetical protein